MFGAIFSSLLYSYLGFIATAVILFALLIIAILVAFDVPLSRLWSKKTFESEKPMPPAPVKINAMSKAGFSEEKVVAKNQKIKIEEEEEETETQGDEPKKVVIKSAATSPKGPQLESLSVPERTDWKLPQFDLLEDSKTDVDSGNIELNVAIIKKTLADFGIEVEMGEVNVGPTVTQYTLRPQTGVEVADDDGLSACCGVDVYIYDRSRSDNALDLPRSVLLGEIDVDLRTRNVRDLRSAPCVCAGRDEHERHHRQCE
jgi:S-DNA-T family DNA segregation ATPase FtsK/SpoIIIE